MLKFRTRSHSVLRIMSVIALALMAFMSIGFSRMATAEGLSVDAQVTTKQSVAGSTIVSPAFSTRQTGEVLYAFVSTDGPSGRSQSISSVTGGGLTWTLRQRTNTRLGSAEIWQAVATNKLNNQKVTARRAVGSYTGMLTVVSFTGAATTQNGAVGRASGTTGAPSVSLTTTKSNSWVWGVGNDWDGARSRELGPGQTMVSEYANKGVGDTFWAQRQTATTAAAGTRVTLNDIAPTNDQWNFSSVEILAAHGSADTQAPTVAITSPMDGTTVSGTTTIAANANDNVGVTKVEFYADDESLGSDTTLPYSYPWDAQAVSDGDHNLVVKAYDAAGNVGTSSATITVAMSGGGGGGGSSGELNLPRVPWEGGPSHYSQYDSMKNTGFVDPNFFPVGVWFESVLSQEDIDKDKQAGLNLYVELTGNSDAPLIRSNGMYTFRGGLNNQSTENVANILTDEPDMMYGPGDDKWSGNYGWNTCTPVQDQGGKCGYTVMKYLVDQLGGDPTPKYTNYGKGVMFQTWESDSQAAAFINQFQQIASNDLYFYTDYNICGEVSNPDNGWNVPTSQCRRAANYGATVDRMRKLDAMDGKRIPIYAFVEDGHPSTEDDAPTINGDQIAGAVFNSLIHEARGIIYFNHNFGGSCESQHVLRDPCGAEIRPKVIETNARIKQLAPVLNTQSYQYSFNDNLDTMLKEQGGSYYIFAMQKRSDKTSGSYTYTLPDGMQGSTVQVMFENRSLPISNGTFTDTFAAEHSYHVYKITP